MKKHFLTIFLFIGFSAVCQTTITKNYESEELQDIRTLKIHLPEGYDKDSDTNYPLAIILDGDYLTDLYKGNATLFSYADKAPKQIIVGIEMKQTRKNDTSFSEINGNLTEESNAFLNFLKNEVLPYMELNFKTSPFSIVVANGATSNLITHFLKDSQPLFNAYVCLNPAFSKDIVTQINSYQLQKLSAIDNTFYFYMSNNIFIEQKTRSKTAELNAFLSDLKIKNFHYKYDVNTTSPNNISAIGEDMPKAMSKIFEIYAGISPDEFDTKIKDLAPLDAIAYLENKYIEIDFLFDASLGIRDADIFAIEPIVIKKENGNYLKIFGEMILNLYPKSEIGNFYIGK